MRVRKALPVLFVVSIALASPTAGARPQVPVTAPPAKVVKSFCLDPFYKKHVDVDGLPILGSDKVSDEAMREAYYIVYQMVQTNEEVWNALIWMKIRVAVMAPSEKTTDIPEHATLDPKCWNDKRGLGATLFRPASSCAEENLLNLPGDPYDGESIAVHEFAHTIHLGKDSLDRTFDCRVQAAYKAALARGLWKDTYAAKNFEEYWAEGVQSYFDCNAPPNKSHNDVDTRKELAKYDPELYRLIDEVFRGSAWRYVRYDKRPPAPRP
jgi:alpha-glucosidase